jgi:uncharacterized BrkB/YihY/UPF0761 family membrane protein
VIWKAKPHGTTVSRLIRARATSLGLVVALGFLLMVSLVVSAALAAFGEQLNSILPFGKVFLSGVNFVISLILISVLFAAIYKVLPDRQLEWRDVAVGAVVTALLFTIGKSLIGWYIGSSATASSYGAAGALIVLLLWVYYSAQTFLLGAEFTKAYANRHGSKRHEPVAEAGTTYMQEKHTPLLRQVCLQSDGEGTGAGRNYRVPGSSISANFADKRKQMGIPVAQLHRGMGINLACHGAAA